ncbi:TPA: hypothetical protein RG395_000655 [Legionella pneumophila]|nr:hypothetical protein [Legionella pneumophila]MDW8879857.1 hypothetical protein [Legionella pneumophila subsp. fraseri]MDW8962187.1 hypothetical protein [Legionella pneumophila subsp. fraseri]MDW9034819.1 hypothetical protein [Legionella pneumophila subsp. fraseri]MDW9037505.1 hypothetical protein [Legionella pneumophila subsp. fraseri]MDW9040940.1 hypothetical protein [Legionella pneumophila subsp. fraseri]
MTLQKYFPWFNEAWQSYSLCRSSLWWPLSYLILTPLAVFIVFGLIIPLGLNQLGWISFDYALINYPYLLLIAGLLYFAFFPFLDALYQMIKAHLDGKPIKMNTDDIDFINPNTSKVMGMSMGPILLTIIVMELAGSFFKPFRLLVLLAYVLAIFTPILSVNNPDSPLKKGLESLQFALNNKKLVSQVLGLRLLILLFLAFPWVIIGITGEHAILKIITLMAGLPFFVYSLVKLLPFYFFYPAYVYHQTKHQNRYGNVSHG